jgi:hypothetical protein
MADEKRIERIETHENAEYRSASKALYDSAMAFGAATGGLGTLGLGAAAVKKAFGGSDAPKQEEPQPQPEPKKD